MKKIIFGLLLIVGIVVAIFYKEILSTKSFYDFQRENPEIMAQSTVNWKQMNFSSADYTTTPDTQLTLHSLNIPVTFNATEREFEQDYVRAYNKTMAITIITSAEPEDLFTVYEFTPEEKTATCQFLSLSSGIGACTSEYNFYRAFLELNDTDVHAFSSLSDKELYLKLMIIRSSVLFSNTVSAFETKKIKGFLFTNTSDDYVAEVFDRNNQRYRLIFSGLDKAEVAFILSNISNAQ